MLTQDVRHLVLEILCSNQWVQEFLPTLDHGVNFTTTSTQILIVVESLPEVVNRLAPGFSTSINQDTDFGLKHLANSVEEPSMRVNFLLVLSLDD